MNWFYVGDGRQLGPVSDSQLDELLSSGKIDRDTQVWREGMPNWQPLSAARAGNAPPGSGAAGKICAECGRTFPPADLIHLNNCWICAQCKPVFLQKLIEGVAPSNAINMWRANKQLVTRSETPLPDRCVKCNAPANGFKMKRVLYWQHSAYYLLLLLNILILIIVVLIVRKKAILNVGVCEQHRAKRRLIITISWLGALGGLALAIIGGAALNSGWAVFIGCVVFLASAIYGGLKGPLVSAAKIKDGYVWLKGVHPDYMAELPEWMGP